jgi:hypothetical protein
MARCKEVSVKCVLGLRVVIADVAVPALWRECIRAHFSSCLVYFRPILLRTGVLGDNFMRLISHWIPSFVDSTIFLDAVGSVLLLKDSSILRLKVSVACLAVEAVWRQYWAVISEVCFQFLQMCFDILERKMQGYSLLVAWRYTQTRTRTRRWTDLLKICIGSASERPLHQNSTTASEAVKPLRLPCLSCFYTLRAFAARCDLREIGMIGEICTKKKVF